jgi:hypothetical protein
MKTTAFILTMLLSAVVSAEGKPTMGYAPVNGLQMYYEVHGGQVRALLDNLTADALVLGRTAGRTRSA